MNLSTTQPKTYIPEVINLRHADQEYKQDYFRIMIHGWNYGSRR